MTNKQLEKKIQELEARVSELQSQLITLTLRLPTFIPAPTLYPQPAPNPTPYPYWQPTCPMTLYNPNIQSKHGEMSTTVWNANRD